MKTFEVKPVTNYEGAQYPSAFDQEQGEPTEDKPHPLFLLLAVILSLGVSVGLIGCYADSRHVTGGLPECSNDAVICTDTWIMEICVDEHWIELDCSAYCAEEYGFEYISGGCNPDAEDPCQCEYGVLDGVMEECTDGDIWCADDNSVTVCIDGWDFQTQSCDDYCLENYGYDSYSIGCDDAAEDPCQCEYGMIDGDMVDCDPGDMWCADDNSVTVCIDGWDFQTQDCDEYCVENYGYGSYSIGCSDAAEERCQCEYDITGGVTIECNPSDIWCIDESTIEFCVEGWDFQTQSCAEYCVENHGYGAVSLGCDDEAEELCQCEFGVDS